MVTGDGCQMLYGLSLGITGECCIGSGQVDSDYGTRNGYLDWSFIRLVKGLMIDC
jgi:hypothetical protein